MKTPFWTRRAMTVLRSLVVVSLLCFLSLTTVQATAQEDEEEASESLLGQRDLVYTSREAVEDLTGCPWFESCGRRITNDRERRMHEPRYKPWKKRFPGLTEYTEFQEVQQGGQEYRISARYYEKLFSEFGPILTLTQINDYRTYKQEHYVHYRISPNGLEEELRPFAVPPELPLSRYRKIRFLRKPFSSHQEDLAHWEVRYPDNAAMTSSYGIQWGDRLDKLRSSPLLANYSLQDPNYFLPNSSDAWFLPQWSRSFANALHKTNTSWSLDGKRTFHVFIRNDDQAIRIIETDTAGRMIRFFQYLAGNELVIRAAGPYTQHAESPPNYCGLHLDWAINPEEVAKASTQEKTRSDDGATGEPVFSNPDYSLVDPQAFFSVSGHGLREWRESFRASPGDLGRWDRSWSNAAGERYQVVAWNPYKADLSDWCLLVYRGGSLSELQYYDPTWLPTSYLPVPPPAPEVPETAEEALSKPSLQPAPPLDENFGSLPHEVINTPDAEVKVGGRTLRAPGWVVTLVVVAIAALLLAYLVVRVLRKNRALDDIRQWKAKLNEESSEARRDE